MALDWLAVAGFGLLVLADLPGDTAVPVWAVVVLTAAMTLPVGFRRYLPRTAFGIVLVATLSSLLWDWHYDWFAAAGFTLYTVAVGHRARSRVLTTVITGIVLSVFPCLTVMGAPSPAPEMLTSLLIGCVVLGGAWSLGQAVQGRRDAAAAAARQLADQRVAEERLRIARELHDVVAHTMSLIAVKAQVANHVGAKRPETAWESLRDIESAAKGSLTEIRHILGILRTGDTIDEAVPRLADLPGLGARAAAAGVELHVHAPSPGPLPAGVELAAYRIVQEAVTNVVKHAAPARCDVSVTVESRELRILVENTAGRAASATSVPGHGLRGMAERVAAYHGEFHADHTADGGFRVTASLPLPSGVS
ncbi:signal transduction histidine kinase [Stackebrandtia albiflava]|uniref:histidine kinase n=1 Tax=Stackebrandtia albiflava TaxID=406432 RepID=A0A562V4X0_9ACTN|nr:signal transduction histidine kinase [Stackebrandtia albiflava]